MPFTKEDMVLIKNVFQLEDYNAKHLVREFPIKSWNIGLVYKMLKNFGLLGWSTVILAVADGAVPASLITLILLTNRCYTKWQEVIFTYCT